MSHFEDELRSLDATYNYALDCNVDPLAAAIRSASQSSLIGVGSGGSYTAASLLCGLHELYSGNVSRPSTPLEIICNPAIAASSPAFFVSAEGNNPDIVEALRRARQRSARTIHVVTNSPKSKLVAAVADLRDVAMHVFQSQFKDGYLATNSLVLNSMVIARAFDKLNGSTNAMPPTISALLIGGDTIEQWVKSVEQFASECHARGTLIVVYSPGLRAVATDLESKLAEAALLHVQLADIRSFAHGRHLWLARRQDDFALLALIDPKLDALWESMRSEFPQGIKSAQMKVNSGDVPQLIAALIAQMHFVSLVGRAAGMDPGRPEVPSFGRRLYQTDVATLVPDLAPAAADAEQEKLAVLGARWPHGRNRGAVRRAREAYTTEIEKQSFRAVVFDYDGTLRTTSAEDLAPHVDVTTSLCRLVDAEITVSIVSGRGRSLRDRLREAVPEKYWDRINLGLYNGGWTSRLSDQSPSDEVAHEFLNHVSRIVERLKAAGAPIRESKRRAPYQVSIRFFEGVDTESMWFVIADAMRGAGLDVDGVVRSRHSIDVLAAGVNKPNYISGLVKSADLLPHELIVFGDQGAWPGNDSSMLEHRYSLSVDLPSRRLDRGWKLAPAEARGVDAMIWYFKKMIITPGFFRMSFLSRSDAGE